MQELNVFRNRAYSLTRYRSGTTECHQETSQKLFVEIAFNLWHSFCSSLDLEKTNAGNKDVLSSDPDRPLLIGKILCAVDPVNVRLQMLSRAMSFARSNQSTICFFMVGDPSETNRALNDLREVISPEKESLCRVEFIQAAGDPVDEILKAIHQFEIDLVVMGHHSRIARTFETLGSVTLRVIPRSNCAVLVVRD